MPRLQTCARGTVRGGDGLKIAPCCAPPCELCRRSPPQALPGTRTHCRPRKHTHMPPCVQALTVRLPVILSHHILHEALFGLNWASTVTESGVYGVYDVRGVYIAYMLPIQGSWAELPPWCRSASRLNSAGEGQTTGLQGNASTCVWEDVRGLGEQACGVREAFGSCLFLARLGF